LRFICTIIQLHQSNDAYFDRGMVILRRFFSTSGLPLRI
jgi:hypothetical protein